MKLVVENFKDTLSKSSNGLKMKANKQRLKVRDFNETLACYFCKGYMIEPTTVDSCLHTYCRSCIVKHLLNDSFCPQCKSSGGKSINLSNLKADEVLRAFIYKLVPGLYQQERERILQFAAGISNGQPKLEDQNYCREWSESEEQFFSPAEPISLSLEYHPALLENCSIVQIPTVRYLQCPASVKMLHLKRFLCSKYDIDPDNKQIEVEVIYEDEVLPNDFTLMDVGYCYNWKRNAPMKFRYRILLCGGDVQNIKQDFKDKLSGNQKSIRPIQLDKTNTISLQTKSVSFSDDTANTTLSLSNTALKTKAQPEYPLVVLNKSKIKFTEKKESKETSEKQVNAPVKVIIARKSAEGKSPKYSNNEGATYTVTSDFKSLRSNDIRYSDYAVTSTTNYSVTSVKNSKRTEKTSAAEPESADIPISRCDIVVSIPHSQIKTRSPNSSDEHFDNVSIAQLKTASKKSPNSATAYELSKKTKNVPKLRIELNSLKTKLTIPKPKSADAYVKPSESKKSKYRKHSLDESRPTADKVDLETYVKNIGLKPIKVSTPTDSVEPSKFSPNASPMSTSSCSTTSSSNGNCPLTSSSEISSSSHKKRKKKHSKDSKDSSNGKRRKLHAEISSQPAKESLKMKVKITASHSHKTHKSESRKSSTSRDESLKCIESNAPTKLRLVQNSTSSEVANSNDPLTMDDNNLTALNRALCEESQSINNLMNSNSDDVLKSITPGTITSNPGTSNSGQSHLIPKPISNIKDVRIPSSPPLPPSLFKTTPLTFTTLAPTVATHTCPKTTTATQKVQESTAKEHSQPTSKSITAPGVGPDKKTSIGKTHQQFAVPNPPRPISNAQKFFATPSSIASAMNKQAGIQLKRSISLDESYTAAGSLTKQQKLEQDRLMRKTAYGAGHSQLMSPSMYQNPLTRKVGKLPNSAIGKSFEMPYYSPISTTYTSQEYGKRKAASVSQQPTLSICKLTDSMYSTQTPNSTGAVTITPRPRPTMSHQSQVNLMPYKQQHSLNKTSLEIVRVASNQIPADILALPSVSPSKNNRLMGPPISTLKNKKPTQQASSSAGVPPASPKSPTTATITQRNNNSYRTSPPALINLRKTVPLIFPKPSSSAIVDSIAKKIDMAHKTSGSSSSSMAETKPKTSLREFRPTSKDGSIDILDLSAGKLQDPTPSEPTMAPVTLVVKRSPNGNSLEATLNKIKQNIPSCSSSPASSADSSASGKVNTDDLQNLHLLSESATAREKIAIKAQLFENPKLHLPSIVRQQNASVRSIPNPSALAFRNQVSIPKVETASTSPPLASVTPQKQTADDKVQPPHNAASCNSTLSSTSAPQSPNPTTTTTQSLCRSTKKPTTIDQVAANLNIRAAEAAKAASSDEPVLVTSTSSAAAIPDNNRIELENSQRSNEKSKSPKKELTSSSSALEQPTSPASKTVESGAKTSITSPTKSALERKPQQEEQQKPSYFKGISSLSSSSPCDDAATVAAVSSV